MFTNSVVKCKPSAVLRHIYWHKFTDVLEKKNVFPFRATQSAHYNPS
jgi:hypothetical protein